MSDEVLRALGRVEGKLEEGARSRDEQGQKLNQLGHDINGLRADLTGFVRDVTEHGRRLQQLEGGMAAVAAMVDHGERIRALEDRLEAQEEYTATQKGVRRFLSWAFTAGCGAIGAIASFWMMWPKGTR